jgi:hypothetical protein
MPGIPHEHFNASLLARPCAPPSTPHTHRILPSFWSTTTSALLLCQLVTALRPAVTGCTLSHGLVSQCRELGCVTHPAVRAHILSPSSSCCQPAGAAHKNSCPTSFSVTHCPAGFGNCRRDFLPLFLSAWLSLCCVGAGCQWMRCRVLQRPSCCGRQPDWHLRAHVWHLCRPLRVCDDASVVVWMHLIGRSPLCRGQRITAYW